ncbi:MCE family protein [Mycolicibacterium parafortuitum]|uniref:MCE family protein n=1 Tax=Mycolicibacterium parafortuitum TaxID=39692 RepID=UPI0009F52DE1|nr:MCE family protein [Mycolicibacterium parafortuitum]ORB31110.1 mammalian cell entry protein [Mycolicibacterium parafortuitum]
MPSNLQSRDPLRTGIFGIAIVVCLVLVSFGYTSLPFWPHGQRYTAYFAHAGGIVPGNPVQIYGLSVGEVKTVELDISTRAARVSFTVDRKIRVGDQSLAAIKTDTVLGQRSIEVTPRGSGTVTAIPLSRTTTPYTLNNALQDLGRNVGELDQDTFVEALDTLTAAMRDATPQVRSALDGITALSRTVNQRDDKLQQLLEHAKSLSDVVAARSDQINQLITDGNTLFAELATRRQAIDQLISGIRAVSDQLSGFVDDNNEHLRPALTRLNLVLDNLNERRQHLSAALTGLPSYATALGEVVGSGPGFQANVFGVPPPTLGGVLLDAYFQPGKLPDSLSDFLRGFITDRAVIRPKSP